MFYARWSEKKEADMRTAVFIQNASIDTIAMS